MGTRGYSPGREADHSPPCSAEVNMSSWRGAWLSTGTTLLLPLTVFLKYNFIMCKDINYTQCFQDINTRFRSHCSMETDLLKYFFN